MERGGHAGRGESGGYGGEKVGRGRGKKHCRRAREGCTITLERGRKK